MEKYSVTGMSCAACSARVEKAVKGVEGVDSCSVSLLTNSMGVEGTAKSSDIIRAVEKAGYKASLMAPGGKAVKGSDALAEESGIFSNKEAKDLKQRLAVSLVFLLILMYFSMGNMMWGWPLPSFMEGNHVAMGLLQLLLTVIIMVINQKFFISGFKSLLHRAPNMDTLVAMGAGASFVYSVYALFAMTDAQMHGNMDAVMDYMHEFYFESAAMILTLITVGKTLEAISKGKTTDALKGLIKLAPKTALIEREGIETEVPIEEVVIGDIFIVKPGGSIPVDGIVEQGESAVNEAALTGESIPVDKQPGDRVFAASINQSGYVKCRATRVGEDTTLNQIIRLVSDAAATKAPIAKVADKVSGVFVPAVIAIAALTLIIWLLTGAGFGYALARGISVLVISCPCALGLATPVAIMVGNGVGAKHGIMFKTAAALEETGRIQIVALDKTGTITMGEPRVTDVIAADGTEEKELAEIAYGLEAMSEHPLAKAVLAWGSEKYGISAGTAPEFTGFRSVAGGGVRGEYKGVKAAAGHRDFIKSFSQIPEAMEERALSLAQEGKTPLFFASDNKLIGIIAVADIIKEDSPKAIEELKNMGLYVVMLTGDNERTARAIGSAAGVDKVIAGVLPEGKDEVIMKLKEYGKTAMVGDGINDAPALTRADIGIAIGAGADIAIDAADVVAVNSRLSDVAAAIRLSRKTLKNIHENLFWAFIYNIIGIPLAAGVWINLFGWELNPMFGAAAMSLSSFCVVTNALRLNLFNIRSDKGDKKIKGISGIEDWGGNMELPGEVNNKNNENKKGSSIMTKTMEIEGMMCGHCEATVKKALEELDGVTKAEVSHEAGTAVVTMETEVANELLIKAVEDKDYKVNSVK